MLPSENVTHLNRRTTKKWKDRVDVHGLLNTRKKKKETTHMTEFGFFCPVDSVAVT